MGSGKMVKLSATNRYILEMKKKIQLSEGQRKALFEVCETSHKKNLDDIFQLKKEISQLMVTREDRTGMVKTRIESNLMDICSTGADSIQMFDLHIIDLRRKMDIFRYNIKQKKEILVALAKTYQTGISQNINKNILVKTDKPIKKVISDLQNNIHAVEVQWREADHVKAKYFSIIVSLQEDSSKFASKFKQMEKDIDFQNLGIKKLEQVNAKAYKLRGIARIDLLQEEYSILKAGNIRNKQTDEGVRLILERKYELNSIERTFCQGKSDMSEEDEENIPISADISVATDPLSDLVQGFDVLKDATGGTSIENVLYKFRSQTVTQQRLALVRNLAESEKQKVEQRFASVNSELQTLKYAEEKDNEQNAEVLKNKNEILITQHKYSKEICIKHAALIVISNSILERLETIYLKIVEPNKDNKFEKQFDVILEKLESFIMDSTKALDNVEKLEEIQVNDEKVLPLPYSGLIRRTPLPTFGTQITAVPPPGTDDEEEEVPSRGYLKRQAQLVVDAKSRRKPLRVPLPAGMK